MDERIRELELAIRSDPADARSVRALIGLKERTGFRFRGRSIGGWVALIDDRWLAGEAFRALIALGPLAHNAAPRAALIAKNAGFHSRLAGDLLSAIGPSAAPVLIDTFLMDGEPGGSPELSERVLQSLGSWKAKAAIAPLRALRSSARPQEMIALERALWRITDDPSPLLELSRAVLEDRRASLYAPISCALSELGPAAGPLVPELLALVNSPAYLPDGLSEALLSAGRGHPRLLVAVTALLDHPRADRSRFAAGVLGQLGPPARPALMRRLRRARLKRRAALVDALARIGLDDAGIELVRSQLKEKTRRLKVAAAEALGPEHGGAPALATLTAALRYDQELAARAARALARFGSAARPAISELLNLARGRDPVLWRAAVEAILAVSPAETASVRAYLAAVRSRRHQRLATRRIAQLGDAAKTWLPGLWACLEDRDLGVAAQAAHELVGLFSPEEAPGLLSALRRILASGDLVVPALTLITELGDQLPEAAPMVSAYLEKAVSPFQTILPLQALAALGPVANASAPRMRAIIEDGNFDADQAASALLRVCPSDPIAVAHFRARLQNDEGRRLACQHLKGLGVHGRALLVDLEAAAPLPGGLPQLIQGRQSTIEAIQSIRIALDRQERGQT